MHTAQWNNYRNRTRDDSNKPEQFWLDSCHVGLCRTKQTACNIDGADDRTKTEQWLIQNNRAKALVYSYSVVSNVININEWKQTTKAWLQ